jgi:hypothetical protein
LAGDGPRRGHPRRPRNLTHEQGSGTLIGSASFTRDITPRLG